MRSMREPDTRFDAPDDFRRQPLRRAVAAGLVVTTIASVLPWIEGTSGFGGPVAINGLTGPGDGGFLIVFGIALTFVVLSRWAAEARAAFVRLMPAILGVGIVLTVITAHRDVAAEIRGIEFEGGHVTTTTWLWAATGGALLMAFAAFWLTVSDRLRHGAWFRAGEVRAAFARRNVVPVAAGVVGALVGFAAVLSVGARTFESELVLAFVVAAIVGGIVGGWAGYRVGRWLVITPPDRR